MEEKQHSKTLRDSENKHTSNRILEIDTRKSE